MASINLIEQSILNPVRVVPIVPLPASAGLPYALPFRLGIPSLLAHSLPFDEEWHIRRLQDWQMNIDYTQKWQLADTISHQYSIPLDTVMTAAIYDCHGTKVKDLTPQLVEEFEGNLIYDYPTKTIQYKYSYEDLGLATGRYYFVLAIEAEAVYLFISEPQEIKKNHFGTVLIRYDHSENRYGTFFSMFPGYSIRVEGSIRIDGWRYTDTSFESQDNETKIPFSNNKRRYSFFVGDMSKARPGLIGVAEWMVDKVVNVLGCDSVTMDDKPFVRNPNTDPEIETYETMPLITAKFSLFEQQIKALRVFGTAESRFDFPISYPFALASLMLGPVVLSEESIINSIADMQAIRDYGNSLDLPGTLSITGNMMIYKHAKFEVRKPFKGLILTKRFKFVITKATTNVWDSASYKGGTILVDYGATGTAGNLETIFSVGKTLSLTKTYTSGTTHTITYWHNDNIEEISFSASRNNYYVSSLVDSSELPRGLTTLKLIDQLSFLTLNSTLFDNYIVKGLSLKTIVVTGCTLEQLPLFANDHPISYFDFRNNHLTTSDFEDFTFNLVGHRLSFNGFIGMSGQAPPAPTNSSVRANMTVLSLFGWTFVTD